MPGLNHLNPKRFATILDLISDLNKCPITTNQPIKGNSIYITFDDGYESVFTEVFPLMENYGMKGIVFPVTAYIGKTNSWDYNILLNSLTHLNLEQLKELVDYGWEVGCHGFYHHPYSSMTSDEIKNDILTAKYTLEDKLDKEIHSYCIPFNTYNPWILDLIFESGFDNIFMQRPFCSNNHINNNRIIYRFQIFGTTTLKSIETLINEQNSIDTFFSKIIQFCSNATICVKELV